MGGKELRRSYSTADGLHSFNYLVTGPVGLASSGLLLLFLCLADQQSPTREAFMYLEVRVGMDHFTFWVDE